MLCTSKYKLLYSNKAKTFFIIFIILIFESKIEFNSFLLTVKDHSTVFHKNGIFIRYKLSK